MTQSSRFWDKIADRYAKSPIANEEAYRHKLDVTRTYLRPDMALFEFGCGTGTTAIAHAPYVKHVHAIDFSGKMIEIARRKAEAAGVENITFETAAIDGFDAAGRTFDAVLGLSILHLLENRDEAVAKVYKMLKPGGVFVSNTACIGGVLKIMKVIAPIGRRLGLLPMLKILSEKDVERSLAACGFDIDYRWQPEGGGALVRTLFIVAKKPGG